MKVKEVTTRDVVACEPGTNLAEAAWKMWQRDCGALPVVSRERVVGMITDRDIAIAAATKDRHVREITVGEVMGSTVHACHEDDDVETAVEIMGHERVRRLPVVDDQGALRGVVSMNDLVLLTGEGKGRVGTNFISEDVFSALRAISRHRREFGPDEAGKSRPAKGTRSREEGPVKARP